MPRRPDPDPPARGGGGAYRSRNQHERIHPIAIIIFFLVVLLVFGYLMTAKRHSLANDVLEFKRQEPGAPLPGANDWMR